ncbi:hypothetical protein Nepgr_006123 [Nepenthes gracilis]|uniref:RING-type domain-containing protein n=1 Tax=Nepenthes gracilis TaxID=150966 RepID=A0AAD3S4U2_NEPGR|nr:hypothetical protein Nepgr_006123 [Nepenthes gracilis]
MGSDVAKASLPAFTDVSDRKKRTKRLAKLKQSKLDVRREQWLSHVKNKGRKVDTNGVDGSSPLSAGAANQEGRGLENLNQTKMGKDEHEILSRKDNELESLMSILIGSSFSNDGLSKDSPGSSNSRNDCSSGSASEEDRDDGSLDDWEAIADALSAENNQQTLNGKSPSESECNGRPRNGYKLVNNNSSGITLETTASGRAHRSKGNNQAWSPDDAFRPRILPNISRQDSLIVNSERCFSHEAKAWSWRSLTSYPSTCPICCEDFDVTDSSFLPCPCGFRLCLFCHKRILEEDGRCPGCRKQYDSKNGNTYSITGPAQFQLNGSWCMKLRF